MPGMPYVYAAIRRCLARDPGTGSQCRRRPSDGVFCTAHAHEFRCQEAARTATELLHARADLHDPARGAWRRLRARFHMRRLRSLRRHLLAQLALTEGPVADIVMAIEGPLPQDERWSVE